jgi:CRISPR-associated protein Cmr4
VRKGDTCGLEHWLGARVAILHASDFQVLSNELPVIARNHLENGTSVNLWYEQVVPRESRFYCPIRESDTELGDMLTSPRMGGLIQIGGNATVGYGLTHFSKI